MKVNGQKQGPNPVRSYVAKSHFQKFNAATLEEYCSRINKLSEWELSEETVKIGLAPGSGRDKMIRQLTQEYKKAKQVYELAIGTYDDQVKEVKEPSEQIKRMLNFIRQ